MRNFCDEERCITEVLSNGIEGAASLCPRLFTKFCNKFIRFGDL